MRFRNILVIVLLSSVLAFSGYADHGSADQGSADFGYVTIVFSNDEMRWPSFIVSDAAVKEIGGKTFLVGVGADTKRKQDVWTGKRIAISMNCISSFMAIETKEEYEAYLAGESTGLAGRRERE